VKPSYFDSRAALLSNGADENPRRAAPKVLPTTRCDSVPFPPVALPKPNPFIDPG
jgi:hypothetical protein